MKIRLKDFRVREGDDVDLKKWPTVVDPIYKSKEQYQEILTEHVRLLSSQQQLLYASNGHAILLIFQAHEWRSCSSGSVTWAGDVDVEQATSR